VNNLAFPTEAEAFRKYSQQCPKLHQAIFGRRFILPQYRQTDYPDQDDLNLRFGEQLHCMALGLFGYADDVHHAASGCMFSALHCNRPILYLERELGEGLMRTKLLRDMATGDLRWRWPSMRIMLPHGLLTIEREAQVYSAQYLDIALVPAQGIKIPDAYAEEIEAVAKRNPEDFSSDRRPATKLSVCMGEDFLIVTTSITHTQFGLGPTLYAYTAPWTNKTLGKLTGYRGNMTTALECDQDDDAFLDRVKQLALNCLLFLSATKLVYTSEVLRRAKHEGKHLKPELARAVFVGTSQLKAERALVMRKAVLSHSGQHYASHWVAGHWRRRHATDGWENESNLVWIKPYQTE
jgi:hypothetical protein